MQHARGDVGHLPDDLDTQLAAHVSPYPFLRRTPGAPRHMSAQRGGFVVCQVKLHHP